MRQIFIFLSLSALLFAAAFFTDLVNWMPGRERFYRPNTPAEPRHRGEGLEVHRNNHFDILVFEPDAFDFGVTTRRPDDAAFFINSNFFAKHTGNPIGLVTVKGKRVSSPVRSGGCFFVSDNRPKVSIGSCPSKATYATQTIFWAIRDGKSNKRLIRDRWSSRKEFRSFIGMDDEGRVVVVVSRLGGIATVGDVIDTGLNFGVRDGLLLDGGSSVEYAYSDSEFSSGFRALSASLKRWRDIPEPPVFIVAQRRRK